MSDNLDNLTKLGEVTHNPSKELEVFPNPNPRARLYYSN
jgi:hypothetical protein